MHPEDERDGTLSRLETLMVFLFRSAFSAHRVLDHYIGISLNFHLPYSRDHHVT